MTKGVKGSPTGPRNVSNRKTFHALSSTIRKKLERLSDFDFPAGFLTGKPDLDNIREMCHGFRRSAPNHYIYRFRKICKENLHIDSTSNLFLEFPDEHTRNDRNMDSVSLTRLQWDKLKAFLKHNLMVPESERKRLFTEIPREKRQYVRTFFTRQGVLELWFSSETGKPISRPRMVDPKKTSSALTPLMDWHPLFVGLQRVDSLRRLERGGLLDSISVSPEQKKLDSEMLEFFDDHGLFDPMTLAEYWDMVAEGWIEEEDEKNWLICRGKDREVPLYDPRTGNLVGPYRGSQHNWPLKVNPADVSELGELDPSSDDAPSSDPASEAESSSSQWDDLEEEFERELKFQDITYDSDDDEDKDWQPEQPKANIAHTLSESPTTSSQGRLIDATVTSSISAGDPSPAPAPAPVPAPHPTTGRRLFYLPPPKPLISPDAGSPDASSDPPPSSPTPTSRRAKKRARVGNQAMPEPRTIRTKPKAATVPSTPPRRRGPTLHPTTPLVNNGPMSDSLQSSDPLDLLSHPVVPAPTRSSTATARAGPSTRAVYRMPVSKMFTFNLGRHTVMVPRSAVDSDEPGEASGSNVQDEEEPGGGPSELRIRKRKRDEEDNGDET
ncbi:hypothetical protein CYLTODRAFT_443314 [Cylindrobasidium torrendii FP15055 ss-10]|uniref:Uncharacterized protein n=1 Tax=Cylindrobasidium torrendii FP15055 ss-10 TaxID=1314674 RepID=A0A0D7BEB9_9AGAR|nr:hypothetical protein CYLTODRAFT_443314 [Cylindrobasidium torrendii FP15055 ss-10]